MSGAPSLVETAQLAELGIRLTGDGDEPEPHGTE